MNARTMIITAAATLALAIPAAQAAIPSNAVGSTIEQVRLQAAQERLHPSVKVRHHTKHRSVVTTWRTCNPYAYVPGGSSTSLSQAIVNAVRRACAP